jgi:hypothetical protein
MPGMSKKYSPVLNESEIQKDFIDVWMSIEESIRIYEISAGNQNTVFPTPDEGNLIT